MQFDGEDTPLYTEEETAELRRAAMPSMFPLALACDEVVVVRKKEPAWVIPVAFLTVFVISFFVSTKLTFHFQSEAHQAASAPVEVTLPDYDVKPPLIDVDTEVPITTPPATYMKRSKKKPAKREVPHAWFHSLGN